MRRKTFKLKIDKDIKGRIYKAASQSGKLDEIFNAVLIEENTLLVDLSTIPMETRIKNNLPKERRTNLYNTKTKTSVHSFYIPYTQLEFEFY